MESESLKLNPFVPLKLHKDQREKGIKKGLNSELYCVKLSAWQQGGKMHWAFNDIFME